MTTILFSLLPVPIEVTYGQSGLNVAMAVTKWNGSSWAAVGSPLAALNTGTGSGTYGAMWTPPDGDPYIVELAVYTDDTFDTIDTDFFASSRSFRLDPSVEENSGGGGTVPQVADVVGTVSDESDSLTGIIEGD